MPALSLVLFANCSGQSFCGLFGSIFRRDSSLPPQLLTLRFVVARLCLSESCAYLAPGLSLMRVVRMPLRREAGNPNTQGRRSKNRGSPNPDYSRSERPAILERERTAPPETNPLIPVRISVSDSRISLRPRDTQEL
jgi:hypothetical protein